MTEPLKIEIVADLQNVIDHLNNVQNAVIVLQKEIAKLNALPVVNINIRNEAD